MTYEASANGARSLSAMFDTRAEADRAVAALEAAGIADVVLTGGENEGYGSVSRDVQPDTRDADRGFFASLGDFFFPEEDRYAYAEGLNRGGYLVTVSNLQAGQYDAALDILDDEGAVDLEARETEWRSEGWSGYDNAQPAAYAADTTYGEDTLEGDLNRDGKIDVVEERLQLAKRETEGGRVRVRSYVREVPVEESIELHSEHVNIERHPVDRPAGDDAFRDQTLEAREYSETPVVRKDARVVEEINLNKESESHTETVRDTVRKTEVEIDDERVAGDRTTGEWADKDRI
ncbi:MAG: hypothetical protein DI498_09735 [Paracoccus denitrificans]|nr:MAG: hypothetical protein DI498_09735 [Paracoccus denitrificans]PZO83984.1 MAG: hypothetical protein DI633_09735 [Paracoccus denitrificans]